MIHMSEKLRKGNRMPKKQTWQECQIFETKGIIDEVQSCRCPVCNKYFTTPFRYYFDYYKYCPSCGTRLYREGEDDEECPEEVLMKQ